MSFDPRTLRILQAASRLIAHYGFDKTTMEDIARESGVSKGVLYLCWSSKDALFDALLNYEMQCLLEDLQKRLAGDPHGGTIGSLYRHTLLALQNHPLMSALYSRDSRILGDYIHRQNVERYTSRLLLSKQALKEMQVAGMLRADISPEILAYIFGMIALGYIHMNVLLSPGSTYPPEEIVEAIAKILLSGMAGERGEVEFSRQMVDHFINFMHDQYSQTDKKGMG